MGDSITINKEIFVSVTLIIVVIVVCSYFVFRNSFWGDLRIKSKTSSIVSFQDITSFDWDHVCVLEPYSLGVNNNNSQRIEQYIKGDLGIFANRIPNLNDDYLWAFVFILNGKVVNLLKSGGGFYIYKDYSDNCIPKKNANLCIKNKTSIYIRDYYEGEK